MSKSIVPNRLVKVKREGGRLVINGGQNCKENGGIRELLRYQEMSWEVTSFGQTEWEGTRLLPWWGLACPVLSVSGCQLHGSLLIQQRMRVEQLPEVLLQNELIIWKQKLTSVIGKHHGCLEKPVTFPFRHHNSILNMSLFTMPHRWASLVWLVTQMLIGHSDDLLLGQFVQLWPQRPSLSYMFAAANPFALGPILHK